VADPLSRQVTLLSMMSVKIMGFERLREDYESCLHFGEVYITLEDGQCPNAVDTSKVDIYSEPTNFASYQRHCEISYFGRFTQEASQDTLFVI
jgi:hypothetical protein